jgi:hypothetical protein
MRTSKRLFSVLVLVLLTSVVLAKPAGLTQTGYNPVVKISRPGLCPYSNEPPSPRIYFGTVVRDTADDQSIRPGWSERPDVRLQHVPIDLPWWVSCFTRNLAGLLLTSK